MSTDSAAVAPERLTPAARRSILGGVITLFIDSYDIYLPALVLPAALGYFEPASMSDTTRATLDTLVFTVTLLGRPIGGPIFGNLSDRIGRKRVALITGSGFTLMVTLMGCLPGYGSWGYGSIIALIALRLIGGIFLGGGYAGPVPLAIERAPRKWRGLVGGLVVTGAGLALVVISLIQILALNHMAPHSFEVWGWRIPFFAGTVMGIAYLAYFHRLVPELDDEEFARSQREGRKPLMQLLTGEEDRARLTQAVLLMTGMWFASQMTVSFLPVLLITVLHQTPGNVSWFEIVSSLTTATGMVLYGALSQKVGRRTLLRWVAVSVMTIGSAAWVFMIHFAEAGASFGVIALMAGIANFVTNAPLGVFVVYLNERFGTQVRAAGYSTAYTFGLILPGLYTVWVKGLAHVVPYAYTALFLIPLGGALVFVAAHRGPETLDAPLLGASGRDRSMDEPGAELAVTGAMRRRSGVRGRVGVRSG
ncbi:MAG TPA: MFS transporter [Solirubrobacteraceae bacterium]|jgi:MFS family permease|nr:MFS transporter [Solirubrobacteraceae bacterium]